MPSSWRASSREVIPLRSPIPSPVESANERGYIWEITAVRHHSDPFIVATLYTADDNRGTWVRFFARWAVLYPTEDRAAPRTGCQQVSALDVRNTMAGMIFSNGRRQRRVPR